MQESCEKFRCGEKLGLEATMEATLDMAIWLPSNKTSMDWRQLLRSAPRNSARLLKPGRKQGGSRYRRVIFWLTLTSWRTRSQCTANPWYTAARKCRLYVPSSEALSERD